MDFRGYGFPHQDARWSPAVKPLHRAAFDHTQRLPQHRRTGLTGGPGDAVEAAWLARGEINRETLLLLRQDVYGKELGIVEPRQLRAGMSDRRHRQGRLKRDRAK